VTADIVLWYSLQKRSAAAQTLNDLIASQPPAPKTNDEKTMLLDGLATAHREAVAQVEAENPKKQVPDIYSPTSIPVGADAPAPEDPVVQAKIKLLESLKKTQ